jgi:DNA-binding transcriptional LysR family regulator
MDFKRLEAFSQVYKLKSFSKAAQALSLSQPTISEDIRLLEEDLAILLFDREGREIHPTKAGEILYQYASKLMALRKESLRAINQYRDKSTGELAVGGSNIPGQYMLPVFLGRFKKQFPTINIRLLIGDSKNITEFLLDGSIEVGLVGSRAENLKIAHQHLIRDEMICIAPVASGLSDHKKMNPKDLSRLPFIIRERGSGTRKAIEAGLKKLNLDINDLQIVAEMGSNEAIRQAVRAGVGISIISRLAVKEDLEKGRVKEIRINRLPMVRDFFIITLKNRTLSPLALDFKELLFKEKNCS